MFKVEKHGSHADHLMRATQFHLVQLSSMADMKANMLLTMSSVVMTMRADGAVRMMLSMTNVDARKRRSQQHGRYGTMRQ